MRPSSMSYTSSNVKTYEKELAEREESWKSELTDLLAKVKGSSIKGSDKRRIINELLLEVAKTATEI